MPCYWIIGIEFSLSRSDTSQVWADRLIWQPRNPTSRANPFKKRYNDNRQHERKSSSKANACTGRVKAPWSKQYLGKYLKFEFLLSEPSVVSWSLECLNHPWSLDVWSYRDILESGCLSRSVNLRILSVWFDCETSRSWCVEILHIGELVSNKLNTE